jgi:hypothetical protein
MYQIPPAPRPLGQVILHLVAPSALPKQDKERGLKERGWHVRLTGPHLIWPQVDLNDLFDYDIGLDEIIPDNNVPNTTSTKASGTGDPSALPKQDKERGLKERGWHVRLTGPHLIWPQVVVHNRAYQNCDILPNIS